MVGEYQVLAHHLRCQVLAHRRVANHIGSMRDGMGQKDQYLLRWSSECRLVETVRPSPMSVLPKKHGPPSNPDAPCMVYIYICPSVGVVPEGSVWGGSQSAVPDWSRPMTSSTGPDRSDLSASR